MLGWFRLPAMPGPESCDSLEAFANEFQQTWADLFRHGGMPEPTAVVETGRLVTGPCQLLLVRVSHKKERTGMPPWIVTDGGAGTVVFPVYYELHEVVNGSRATPAPIRPVTMVGPVCYATDWIYRNKPMPPVHPGDVLAVLDTGAYFSVLACNFGFLRPAVVGIQGGTADLLQRRETPEDVIRRDLHMDASV